METENLFELQLIVLNKNHFMRMIRENDKTFPIFSGNESMSILKYFQ